VTGATVSKNSTTIAVTPSEKPSRRVVVVKTLPANRDDDATSSTNLLA
jgi:hypothetical protein